MLIEKVFPDSGKESDATSQVGALSHHQVCKHHNSEHWVILGTQNKVKSKMMLCFMTTINNLCRTAGSLIICMYLDTYTVIHTL